MPDDAIATCTRPDEKTRASRDTRRLPPYRIILLDDNDHTYEYVIEMLEKLFCCTKEQAFLLAAEVDMTGSVVLDTTTKERAEFKQQQIHGYGADWRLARCAGSMTCLIEPVED